MYNDTLKVANKIITENDLLDIFHKMWEEIEKYKRICNQETMQNQMLEYNYQSWTCKDFNGKIKFTVYFYDNTSIDFDNYNNFIGIFNNRLDEIKSIYLIYSYSYTVKPQNNNGEYYYQSISMWIHENKIKVDISLSSVDKKMDDVYNFIKQKILTAPEKYDEIIKNKASITSKISFATGAIPAIIITSLTILIPTIRQIYGYTYILYPMICIALSFVIGSTFFGSKLANLYETLIPDKKYAGYDTNKGKSIYKDDIDKFIETSEIIMGKNTNNLKNRKEITTMLENYSKYIPYELIVILVMSIIVVILGKIL